MAPKKRVPWKNIPKKSAPGSSSQQTNKGKEIASKSPLPHFGHVVEKEIVIDPNAFFEVETIVSKITTQGRVNKIMLSHNIEVGSSALIARPPFEGERSCTPLQDDFAGWSDKHLRVGTFLPLDQYFADFLNYVKLAPFQLPPNSYRLLAGLRYLFLKQMWEVPTPADILYFFCLEASPNQRG